MSALGGPPLAFESTVINVVKLLQDAGLKLHFVFNGLDSGIGSDSLTSSARAAQLGDEAFTLYETQEAKKAKDVFKASGMLLINCLASRIVSSGISGQCHPSTLSEILKKTLHEQGVPFTVAPYSALAQVSSNGLCTLAMLTIYSLYTMRSTQANSSMPYTAHRSSSALALTGLLLSSSSAIVART